MDLENTRLVRRASDESKQQLAAQVIMLRDGSTRMDDIEKALREVGVALTQLPVESLASDEEITMPPMLKLVIAPSGIAESPHYVQSLKERMASLAVAPEVILAAREELSFAQRLALVPLGAVRLFGPQDDLKDIRSYVRRETRESSIAGYRVLLIEDSASEAYTATKFMTQAGLDVRHITDAMTVLDELADFRPDVVITKYTLPTTYGDEVAAVIRQDPRATMPILFLTSLNDTSVQFSAMAKGCDGVLQKPLREGPFMAALKSIISRARLTEFKMNRDPLTNLLNRGHFVELAKHSAVSGKAGVVAMLDVDHFKKVNDTYGHAVGDKVLVKLSELLVDMLRASDHVGRLGGEEFAVVFNGATFDQAQQAVERVLAAFRDVDFKDEDGNPFRCTFSAGLSALAPDVHRALGEADAALYQAKTAGRNRVMLAQMTAESCVIV